MGVLPTDKEYYRRKLIKEYKTLKGDRTQELNRLHALFVQCGITTIKRSNVQTDVNRQEVLPQLFGYEARQAQRLCERLTMLEAGKGKKISVTAIARKMAKLLYLVMKNKQMEYQEMPAPALQAG